jgi:hypothetical protein
MKNIKLLFYTIFICQYSNSLFSQGCSDAGFCTVNSFKPNNSEQTIVSNNQFKIGTFFGSADNSIVVIGNYFEYNRQLNENFSADLKLTTLAQSGNGISTFGLADAFVNINYKASEKIQLTIGGKIPMSKANNSENGLPLPMDYQASLGTFDIILGVGYKLDKFQVVAAFQQPLTQNNNQFFASAQSTTSNLKSIQTTNNFKRSGDVLLRISYPVKLNQKLNLVPSLLPIYHLSNDKFTDEFNIERQILGSKGLTLNGNVFLDYNLNSKNTIQLSMAAPFVVRDSRPDGLTRGFVANVEYRIKF